MYLLHPRTKKQIELFMKAPSHALLLEGSVGSGTQQALQYVFSFIEKNRNTFHSIEPEKKSISIEQIRQSRNDVKHRHANNELLYVVVKRAHTMTTEAQNALLKQLEEPAQGIVYILQAEGTGLLPTIHSRTQRVTMLPVSLEQATKASNTATSSKNYLISSGGVGLYLDLETGSTNELVTYIQKSKEFLGSHLFQKFVFVEAFIKQKSDTALFLTALQKTCHAALVSSKGSQKWIHNTEVVLKCQQYYKGNVQAKLVLDLLVTSLV